MLTKLVAAKINPRWPDWIRCDMGAACCNSRLLSLKYLMDIFYRGNFQPVNLCIELHHQEIHWLCLLTSHQTQLLDTQLQVSVYSYYHSSYLAVYPQCPASLRRTCEPFLSRQTRQLSHGLSLPGWHYTAYWRAIGSCSGLSFQMEVSSVCLSSFFCNTL